MGIFSRFNDIVNSNITAMLDRAEDPTKMVRLIVEEMVETLVEVRSQCAKTLADKKELNRKRGQHLADAKEWDRKAQIAVEKNRDDLARAALQERKKSDQFVDAIDAELETVEELLTKLNADIATLSNKLADARARQASIVARGETARARLGIRRQLNDRNIDDAMARFEQWERRIDDLEGSVEAYDAGKKTLADEIDELVIEEDVESDLQELKQRVKESNN